MRCNSLMDIFNLNQIQIKQIFLYSLSFESIFISCIKLFIVSLKLSVISIPIEFAKHNNTNKLSPNSALIVFASSESFFFFHHRYDLFHVQVRPLLQSI